MEQLNQDSLIQEKFKEGWKLYRWGVYIMTFLHWVISVIFRLMDDSEVGGAILPVLFSYYVSRWYIKRRISQGETDKNPFWYGVWVALFVMIMQMGLGIIVEQFLMSGKYR